MMELPVPRVQVDPKEQRVPRARLVVMELTAPMGPLDQKARQG